MKESKRQGRRHVCFALLLLLLVGVTIYKDSMIVDQFHQFGDLSTLRKSDVHTVASGKGAQTTDTVEEHLMMSIDKAEKKNSQKYFIYHAGPPKTATTELQVLAKRREDLLQQDNYVYDGMRQSGPLKEFLQSHDGCRESTVEAHHAGEPYPACWQQFRKLLDNYTDHNVLYSCETDLHISPVSDPDYIKILQAELQDRGYELQFLIAYRRLFEWIPSVHTQMNRGMKPSWTQWPADGGKYTHSLKNQVMSIDYVNQTHGEFWTTWTAALLEWLPEDSVDIKILNMYTPGSMETKFFCDFVPNMPAMCEFVKKAEANGALDSNANPSTPIWYDTLAVDAADRGLVDTNKYNRVQVKDAIQHHQEVTLNLTSLDFPWLCPSEKDMQQILDVSLMWERRIVPDFDDKKGLQESFQYTVDKKKFCDLDTNATLAMEVWRDFFQAYASKV